MRSKIVHIVQNRYLAFLSRGVSVWARHTIGVRRAVREADRFALTRRHLPLHYTFDRWVENFRLRRRATRSMFKMLMSWHLRQIDPAFDRWSKFTESERVRRRQIVRVFSKIRNLKLSQAYNTWYHACQETKLHDLKCQEAAYMGWLSFLTRRHRLKWLLMKLCSSSIRDLARESFKIWHLVAHRRADQERFEDSIRQTRTHIAHLKARR